MNRKEILKILKQYKADNQKKYKIIKIGIFGSVARETMTDQSDIDIVVEIEKQDLFNLIGIKQDLEDHLLLPIDIVSYRDTMNQFLKERIDKEAVYV